MKRKTPPSLPLPGFEDAIARQREAAAELVAEGLEQILVSRCDISAKAGLMERESPLFTGTGASGQNGFFNGSTEEE